MRLTRSQGRRDERELQEAFLFFYFDYLPAISHHLCVPGNIKNELLNAFLLHPLSLHHYDDTFLSSHSLQASLIYVLDFPFLKYKKRRSEKRLNEH